MVKPRVLVTGASGFTGHYVCKELINQGFDVFALTHDGSVHGKSVDLCSYADVRGCIEQIKPESVVHLAAIAFVEHGIPNDFYRVNVEGTLNLVRALEVANCIKGTVALASSANIYGNAYQNQSITESCSPQPLNDYAVSKLSMEYMARLHMDRLPITIVRPFNYTGCGQRENFLIPKIVKAFNERQRVIELGNLNVSRDFSDVRDIAYYYSQLVLRKVAGRTVNFCSGQSVALMDIISMCEKLTGHTVEIRSIDSLKRKSELRHLEGNPKMLHELIDRGPYYTIESTLAWMLNSNFN